MSVGQIVFDQKASNCRDCQVFVCETSAKHIHINMVEYQFQILSLVSSMCFTAAKIGSNIAPF
jgi:hypothetical protein